MAPEPRPPLDVHLGDAPLGTLGDRTTGFVAFDFDEQAILRHGVGSRILSIALPVAWETADPLLATPFFAGLLPEGRARERLCQEFRVSPDDTFALLQILGRESVGALVIVPAGTRPPTPAGAFLEPMHDDELARTLARLDLTPLGVSPEGEVRLSLAGVQGKLPVVQLPGRGVALPIGGWPSTHIAKPENGDPRFPQLVANEAFCLAACTRLGVATTRFSLISPAGQHVLLVERYDRRTEPDGTVWRIHQEDVCQATATYPQRKYETAGGPGLARVAALLSEHSSRPALDRLELFRLTVANLLLGNCDAHGKNISLLHGAAGIQLAPAYDVVSTEAYDHTDVLGMRVGGLERLRDVDRAAVLREAAAMRVPERLAERTISEVLERLDAALDGAAAQAHAEGWAAPIIASIAAATRKRAARIFCPG